MLTDLCEDILNEVVEVMNEADVYLEALYKYAVIWQDDRDECMELFLLYGRIPAQMEIDANGDNIPKIPPTLGDFRAEVW